jgi:PAS domain S-box-containing protein
MSTASSPPAKAGTEVSPEFERLRQKAEDKLRNAGDALDVPHLGNCVSPTAADRLVHELMVHEVELKMQNDQLLETQRELALARDRYHNLFDYAPVGFVTLDAEGAIIDANLTLALLLGVKLAQLARQPFARYLNTTDLARWKQQFSALLREGYRLTCCLKMQPGDGTALYARLHVTRDNSLPNVFVRIAVIDISEAEYHHATSPSISP